MRVAAFGLVVLVFSGHAHACPVCSCGDPTLTVMGVEKPYAGRLRAALEVRQRTDAIGEPRVDQISLSEQRLDAQLAWAPWSSIFLQLVVPTLHRTVDYVNGARRSTTSLGDLELRAKVFVWQDRKLSSRHLVAI